MEKIASKPTMKKQLKLQIGLAISAAIQHNIYSAEIIIMRRGLPAHTCACTYTYVYYDCGLSFDLYHSKPSCKSDTMNLILIWNDLRLQWR